MCQVRGEGETVLNKSCLSMMMWHLAQKLPNKGRYEEVKLGNLGIAEIGQIRVKMMSNRSCGDQFL